MNNNKPDNSVPLKVSRILLEKYPDLSPAELRICELLSLNMTSRAIAEKTSRSVRTIEYTRNNIRKKMKLTKADNLVSHLIQVSGKEI